jgi:hypothetical protein
MHELLRNRDLEQARDKINQEKLELERQIKASA